MARFRRLNNFLVEVADVGETPNSRTIIFRHALPARHADLVEITPGARVIILGGEQTKQELKRALEQIGRHQLSEYLQADISANAHHQLLTHLKLTRDRR